MNYHQTPEDIIRAATPEQRILWNYIFLRFGEKIALQQVFYYGNLAGSEFLIYSANKLYIALQLSLTFTLGAANATASYVSFFNELNVLATGGNAVQPAWDTTAAAYKYGNNDYNSKNEVFARILATNYSQIKFIGYRLGI